MPQKGFISVKTPILYALSNYFLQFFRSPKKFSQILTTKNLTCYDVTLPPGGIMRFGLGFLTAFALVFVWVKWSRPWLQWLFSRGDVVR